MSLEQDKTATNKMLLSYIHNDLNMRRYFLSRKAMEEAIKGFVVVVS